MKYFAVCFLLIICQFAKAQDAPIKWATQETFFEDLVGKRLPAFNGLTVNNVSFKSESLKDQIVLLNFWFINCPPCIAEMPELNKLADKYASKGVRFIGLTFDSPAEIKRFQKTNGYKYELISVSQETIRKINLNHGFPTNILVAKNGNILYAMANVSFDIEMNSYIIKSMIFEEKLKSELSIVYK
ncbi:peroxiredoxin family protein [Pedobacter mucosus]|uniref:peroxiredoxin family protein n=1 Tax=Pedobacter mucosus TaxID=2895286 RepID=UPI001EE4BA42|nr:TlpA disulfide reductase family protein [Pedobacter mucosus]UKT63715.1 TlpA family protein disulfide reductase [Pedobacter mucosus]